MATSSGAAALKCPTMLARCVKTIGTDSLAFVGMMPVQARMPVCEFETVASGMAQAEVVGIDKSRQPISRLLRASYLGCCDRRN